MCLLLFIIADMCPQILCFYWLIHFFRIFFFTHLQKLKRYKKPKILDIDVSVFKSVTDYFHCQFDNPISVDI